VPICTYCQLCKLNFEDYLEHTESSSHSNQIAASSANPYIEELAASFLQPPERKRKQVKKEMQGRSKGCQKKNSCKILKVNISHIGKTKTSVADSKNSNQSTNLLSTSY
jgi:hypothetical protein